MNYIINERVPSVIFELENYKKNKNKKLLQV